MSESAANPHATVPSPEELVLPVQQAELQPELTRTQQLLLATKRAGNIALRATQTAFVAAEINPIINEGSRYLIFGAAESASHSPAIGALSYGLSTFVIEEAGALASASLFNTPKANRFFEALNAVGKKLHIPMDKKVPTNAKIGITYFGGSVVGMALEQREDPTRTVEQNRRYGLWTSTWLAGVCAVQGALMSEGINVGLDHPGGAGITVGTAVAGFAANKLRKQAKVKNAQEIYNQELDTISSPQRAGIGDAEVADALRDKNTVLAKISRGDKKYYVPVLVPTRSLYWYNQELLQQLYPGQDTYFYTQVKPEESVTEAVGNVLEDGKVMLAAETPMTEKLVEQLRTKFGAEKTVLHESLHDAFLNQYVGEVTSETSQTYRVAPDFIDQYKQGVEQGIISEDPENGPTIVDKIEGESADRLWAIYEKPFENISLSSPINAGFDKEGFYKALKDPSVVKVINRHEGEITTLAFFETDLKNASWLNKDYFSHTYPEAYASQNILLFLGIVSDENMRGNAYSVDLINLLLRVAQLRDTKTLITFECNEVSSHYLPQLVEAAINGSGHANVSGLNRPVSQTRFSAVRLA